jgi:hypothetical protein
VLGQLRQVVVAMAALLMAVLALLMPVDRTHLGRTDDRVSAPSTPTDLQTSESPASGAHQHHADGPSLFGSTAHAIEPTVSLAMVVRFHLTNDRSTGLTSNPQDRPPKPDLESIA